MQKLIQYIINHTDRGECQCGRCIDKGPDRPAPKHSVNVHFFWVSAKNNPTKEEFVEVLNDYPDLDRLKRGPSYIELGAELGSQDLALRLIGLGELVGVWPVITPAKLTFTGAEADQLAGSGMVMAGGME